MQRKVLIVDDTPRVIRIIKDILLKEGFEVIEAGDGEAGVEIAMAQLPDLILMDVGMPKMSGWEACRILKNDPKTKKIPIIILTFMNQITDKLKSKEVGADKYIAKPFSPKELLKIIKSTLKN